MSISIKMLARLAYPVPLKEKQSQSGFEATRYRIFLKYMIIILVPNTILETE
uniref:Uncharacterized protein n=1 Tax=Solanum tuberosum TaxID=4113 RepID=M1BNB2_SOLTU